jgi:pimeloyl-ACP methyl ester carboxylesterase
MNAFGTLPGQFPYVRFGTGPAALVVLPGMAFDNPDPGPGRARAYALSMRRLAVGRTVTVLHRPRGVAEEASKGRPADFALGTADLADMYAPVIQDEFGPVDVMAFSTGGLIAQHLALRHPALVRRLVLVVSGARIAEAGRQICATWATLCQQQDWRSLRGGLLASAVDGPVATWLARLLGGSGRDPDPTDVSDFTAAVAAVLRHDATGALHGITMPTLILGGRDDPFFPEPVLRATAAEIPDAHVEVHAGGHGVPKHHSRWLQDQVAAFLAHPPGGE